VVCVRRDRAKGIVVLNVGIRWAKFFAVPPSSAGGWENEGGNLAPLAEATATPGDYGFSLRVSMGFRSDSCRDAAALPHPAPFSLQQRNPL